MRQNINERKKAELDALKIDAENAQFEVDQLQAVVSSLMDKSAEFSAYLTTTEGQKETALNNYNMMKGVVDTIHGLKQYALTVHEQTSTANVSLDKTSDELSTLIDELILSAEIVNKLALLVNKKKALNPLISDELVSVLTTATEDANTAIAATLTALQSCYTAVATTQQSTQLSGHELTQAAQLYRLITGTPIGCSQSQLSSKITTQMAQINSKLKTIGAIETQIGAASKKVTAARKAERTSLQNMQNAKDAWVAAEATAAASEAAKVAADEKAKQAKETAETEKTPESEAAYNAAQVAATAAETQATADATKLTDAINKYTSDRQDYTQATLGIETAEAALQTTLDAMSIEMNQYMTDEMLFNSLIKQQVGSSLQALLTQAYADAVSRYNAALKANSAVTQQLEHAKAALNRSEVTLQSLQAGLSAANSAALAA